METTTNQTVKERLKTFIKFKGFGQGKFESMCGLSNGYVNNIRQSILPDKLQKIALQFPDLNTGWLMTGEGEMLKNIHQTANGDGNMQVAGNGNTVTHTDTALTKALDENAELRKLVSKAQEQIDRLIGLLEKK